MDAAAPTKKALVLSAFEALNRKDLAYVKQLWTTDTIEHFPDQTCRGADAIEAYFAALFRGVPDWHLDVVAAAEDGENVFVHWHLTGTHEGALMGIEPTGKRLSLAGIDHFVVRDGKVVSNTVVFDQMAFGRQLGLLPPDGSAADRGLKAAFNLKTKLARTLGG